MMNNLEGIAFEEVIAGNGTSYASFRKTLEPRYGKVMFDIGKGYFFLILFIIISILVFREAPWTWWIISPVCGMMIGYCTAYIALFIHEAGHFNIHPDKVVNDKLATWLLCLPFGLSMKSYRKIHWQHHLHLGTMEDAEVSYFKALTKLFMVEMLTGIHLLKTVLRKEKNPYLGKEQLQNSRKMLIAGILFHLAVITVLLLTGNWPAAIAWVLGFGIFFPFFAALRQVLEHRDEKANSKSDFFKTPHGKVSRIFVHNIISSSFGSAGFTRHMIHHWDPQISYTRLADVEEFLEQSERTADFIKGSRTNYSTVLNKLLKAN
jgi:fatty acid desaturase